MIKVKRDLLSSYFRVCRSSETPIPLFIIQNDGLCTTVNILAEFSPPPGGGGGDKLNPSKNKEEISTI